MSFVVRLSRTPNASMDYFLVEQNGEQLFVMVREEDVSILDRETVEEIAQRMGESHPQIVRLRELIEKAKNEPPLKGANDGNV